jgi:predicted GNAT family N-acyltransferase
MELIELAELTDDDWAELLDGEVEPWGPVGERLQWLAEERHLALRAPDGRIVAAGGAAVVAVDVEGDAGFEVVGLGSLFVTRSQRGSGLMSMLVEPLLSLAREMVPDRAMIFCRPELLPVYGRVGFAEIAAPVWADQPGGRVRVPMRAMWRPLREGARWPPGRVDVHGAPF